MIQLLDKKTGDFTEETKQELRSLLNEWDNFVMNDKEGKWETTDLPKFFESKDNPQEIKIIAAFNIGRRQEILRVMGLASASR